MSETFRVKLAKGAISLVCPICDTSFYRTASKIRPVNCCSRKCLGVVNAQRQQLVTKATFFDETIKVGECWEWPFSRNRGGYGKIVFEGKQTTAHRVAFLIARGALARGDFVCHTCDNPICVRPDHLFVGDAAANARDMAEKGRACRGHAHHSVRLSPKAVREIRASAQSGRLVAAQFGVSKRAVQKIRRRQTWAWVA